MLTLAKLPIGSKIYMGTIYGNPIVWRKIEDGHSGYPTGSTTLICDKMPFVGSFDAKEPNNTQNASAQHIGNNSYRLSNIRQWLNSNAAAGAWYSAQHSFDEPPSINYISSVGKFPYDTSAGWLNGFTAKEQSLLMDTSLTVATNSSSETVIDKMFILSLTEMGLTNDHGTAEGVAFSYFSQSRLSFLPTADVISKYSYPWYFSWYWLRSINSKWDYIWSVNYSNTSQNIQPYDDYDKGVLPVCNLPQSTKVSNNPNSKGVYSLA